MGTYIVKLPPDKVIEDLYPQNIRDVQVNGKVFTASNTPDKDINYDKVTFFKEVVSKEEIDFGETDFFKLIHIFMDIANHCKTVAATSPS